MNGDMHELISIRALEHLEAHGNTFWKPYTAEIVKASNYPDVFAAGEDAASHEGWDPDWRYLNQVPFEDGTQKPVGMVFDAPDSTKHARPISLFTGRALESLRAGNFSLASRVVGVMSHLFGDSTQAAHVSNNRLIKSLYPQDHARYSIHYFMEHISGGISDWPDAPQVLAGSADMLSWIICEKIKKAQALSRYEIPILMDAALHRRDREAAESAGRSARLAAVLLADFMYSVQAIYEGRSLTLSSYALTDMTPVRQGGDPTILDQEVAVDMLPARQFDDPILLDLGEGPVSGICILPVMAPAYDRVRDCYADYALPGSGVSRFTARLGIARMYNPDQNWCGYMKNETDAVFEIRLDGKTVYRSPAVSPSDPPLPVSVPVGSAKTLTLYARDARDPNPVTKFVWPVFAEPTLIFGDD